MKNRFFLIVGLFAVSCKTTSLNFGFTGKWQSDYYHNYTLELYNDKSFTYTEVVGCCADVYHNEFHGTWTYLKPHTILLSFPCISDDVITKVFDPLLTGKEVQVQVVDSRTMKIDSLAQNVVLKRVAE
jgi:hypothetical protein